MISSGLRVQLHLPSLDLTWNLVMTHTDVRVLVGKHGALRPRKPFEKK